MAASAPSGQPPSPPLAALAPPQNSSTSSNPPPASQSAPPPAQVPPSPPARAPPAQPSAPSGNPPSNAAPPPSPPPPPVNPSPPPPILNPPPPSQLPPAPPASSPPPSPPPAPPASAPLPLQTPAPPLISSPPPLNVQSPPRVPANPSAQRSPPFSNSFHSPPHEGARSPPAVTGNSHVAPKGVAGNGSAGGSKFSTTALVGIAVGGAVLIGIIVMLLLCLVRKRSRKRSFHANYEYSSGHYQTKVGRKPRYESPYSSSEVGRKPQPPPAPPLMSNGSRQSSGPAHSHLPNSTNDSGSATEALSPRKFAPPPPPPGGASSLGNPRAWFTFEELEEATQGFSRSNLLGQGGFGYVFRGVLPGGLVVAVKRLKVGGKQGEREFQAEVETITRAHHRHLVSLVGYCIADTQRLLVYEYVPNGTLEFHLHGKGGAVLDWNIRLKIAIGAARGLAYLHEDCQPKIIHRDIKSSNILLDEHFEAKVADFGLAKYASDTHSHVSTRVMGTFGYMAPEYASTGKLTAKSDVFSFGVVLLELLTGRKPIDSSRPLGNESLVEWARPLLAQAMDDGILIGLVDARLGNEYDLQQIQRMIEITAACVRHSANKRPKMIQVVRALEDDGADLSSGLRPVHSVGSPFGSVDYENKSDQSEISRLRKMAIGTSQDHSAYSGVTSEYGLNPSTSGSEQQSSKEIDSRHHESDEKRWN